MGVKTIHAGLCVQPPPINGFQKAFIDEVGIENYREISCGEKNFNQLLRNLFNDFKPEIVFTQIQTPGIIDRDLVKYISDSGCKVISWNGDIRAETPQWMIDIAPYCISSFSNMRDVRFMRDAGFKSEYLEIGYDPEIYRPDGDKMACPEVVFMANNYVDMFPLSTFRSAIVKTLAMNFNSLFGVYGSGWPGGSGNLNHSQPEESKYYRGAKIAINCSNFKEERYSSDRLLRIMGSGCFCISHKFKNMDYVDGVHLVTFENMNDLVDKIKYYLCHDEERNKIAYLGQQLVLSRNTFRHQVKNIIKL